MGVGPEVGVGGGVGVTVGVGVAVGVGTGVGEGVGVGVTVGVGVVVGVGTGVGAGVGEGVGVTVGAGVGVGITRTGTGVSGGAAVGAPGRSITWTQPSQMTRPRLATIANLRRAELVWADRGRLPPGRKVMPPVLPISGRAWCVGAGSPQNRCDGPGPGGSCSRRSGRRRNAWPGCGR